MKKISIFIILFICLFASGCGSNKTRTAATLSGFDSIFQNNGFTITSDNDKYKSVDYITSYSLATYDEDTSIEMIIYTDSDYAIKVQEQQIESFNLLKSTGAQVIREKGSNYYEYALISNNRYMISTRVDNTLIFAKVMLKDKDFVDGIITSLGY